MLNRFKKAIKYVSVPALLLMSLILVTCVSGMKKPIMTIDKPVETPVKEEPQKNTVVTPPVKVENPRFETRCIGDEKAEKYAIFLHGMRRTSVANSEAQSTDKELENLAERAGYRIAVPRSDMLCRNKTHFCWGGTSTESIESTYEGIINSAGTCFDTKKPFVVIGFSDGGYHIARAIMLRLDPQPQWTIAIGSSGNIGHVTSGDLSEASRLTLLVGNSDQVLHSAKYFGQMMKAKKADVEFKTYAGGHVVPYDTLADMLAS